MLCYQIEVKSSDARTAGTGKWGHPGRVWVRGYDESGKKIEQYHVGFVDLRYSGPRSHFARVYASAESLIAELTATATATATATV